MRSRLAKLFALLSLMTVGAVNTTAFSLLGAFTPWMDDVKYYTQGAIGGPMNLGEEFRWNMPAITYAFDPTFLNYFGSNGLVALQQAVKIINDLPPASQIDLSKYPMNTARQNYRAKSLLLMDIKSVGLALLMEELGSAQPERYVWCFREHWDDNNVPFWITIKRNFDPVTTEPSSYVNGQLYTYTIFHQSEPVHLTQAAPIAVDTLQPSYSAVAGAGFFSSYGQYYSGLTRDDVGGLKYKYRSVNMNVETLIPNLYASTNFLFMGSNSNGWFVANVTNSFSTNAPQPVVPASVINNQNGGGWYPVIVTNAVSTNQPGGTGTGTGAVGQNTNLYVNAAIRNGIEKITLVPTEFDTVLGQYITTTNIYMDTFITNGMLVSQALERTVTNPDIIFSARDLGLATHFPVIASRSSGWVNNAALNTALGGGGAAAGGGAGGGTGTGAGTITGVDGPGIISPSIEIAFTRIGPYYYNGPGFITEATASPGGGFFFVWGSYDGTTNAPVVYPNGTSLRNLELMVFGY